MVIGKRILAALFLLAAAVAAAPGLAQTGPRTGPMAMPPRPEALATTAPATDAPDLLAPGPRRLAALRDQAAQASPQWRRLIRWATAPERQDGKRADGPNLALAALTLAEADGRQSSALGHLAARAAIDGARAGRVEQLSGAAIIDGGLPWKPEEITAEGYDLLAFDGPEAAIAIKKITPTQIVLASAPTAQARQGAEYLLLISDMERAGQVAEDVALTLAWGARAIDAEQRKLGARWLLAQAKVAAGRPMGCFDRQSAAALKIMALAGRVAEKLYPQPAQAMAQLAMERFERLWRPALEGMGQGGGWFGGTNAGARAGLDLLLVAACQPAGPARQKIMDIPWFRDRLAALTNSLLPHVQQGPNGPYRGLLPSGGEVMPPDRAADLARIQMLVARALLPGAAFADVAQAMLLASDAPGVTDHRLLGLEFLLLDTTDPGLALAVAPLDHVASAVGRACSRSGWSAWDTLVAFDCGPHFVDGQRLDAASLQIYLNGPLLPRGGAEDGRLTPHAMNYALRSVAANTILIHDPTEYSWPDMGAGDKPRGTYANDGGQRAWALFGPDGKPRVKAPWTASGWENGAAPWTVLEPVYNVAAITAQGGGESWAYFKGQATAAYQGQTAKAKRVERHVFHLRPGGPDDATSAKAVVVVDDVIVARPELRPSFVLHFSQPPVVEGQMTQLAPGRLAGQARMLRVQTDGARLWVVGLRQDAQRVELFGPPAVAWVDGRGYPPAAPATDAAPWRVELTPTGPDDGQAFALVHALLPAPADAPAPPELSRLTSPDRRLAGAVIHDRFWPRVVAVNLEPDERPIAYQYPAGRSRHLVAGLRPETEYTVAADGRLLTITPGKGLKSSAGGLLAFKLAPVEGEKAPAAVAEPDMK